MLRQRLEQQPPPQAYNIGNFPSLLSFPAVVPNHPTTMTAVMMILMFVFKRLKT